MRHFDFSSIIRSNFNKAAISYDRVAYVQRQTAEFLVEKLLEIQIKPPKRILDLGTGTGYVPELLLKHFPTSSYLLNDIADRMLEVCKSKFSHHDNFAFINSDMTKLEIEDYNLVINNLSLQWIDDLWNTIKKFYANSEVFAFSTLLKGTFQEWEKVINLYDEIVLNQYPTVQELIDYCNSIKGKGKFHYWVKEIIITFETPLLFMRYIKHLGASSTTKQMSVSNLKALLNSNYKPLTVSYKIFFGILVKVE